MSRRLLISAAPGEWRTALVENGTLVDFRLVRLVGGSRIGEIHLGRLVRRLPALRAALVEIGLERPAYLSLDDAASKRGGALVHEGAAILVQVKRDARADKAVGVTMRLCLNGRFLDWTPARPGARVEMVALPERARVAAMLDRMLKAGEGALAHPHAAVADAAALEADVTALRTRWTKVETERRRATPPCRLYAINPIADLLGDFLDEAVDAIIVDDAVAFVTLRGALSRDWPAFLDRLARHRGTEPLFEAEGIADAVAMLMRPRVALAGGGALLIVPTPAGVLIDVDSGSLAEEQRVGEEALLAVDLAAAAVIARQIRLRGLAGAIVVDFIALSRKTDRERLLEAFRTALMTEVPEAQLLGWTRLGHVEVTHPRRRAASHEVLFEPSPDGRWVKTPLTVALEALAEAQRAGREGSLRPMRLHVHPQIAAVLAGEASPVVSELEASLGQRLEILPEPSCALEHFAIEPGPLHN